MQAKQIDVTQLEHVRIRSAVGQMAGLAPIDFDRLMLEDEGALLVNVALEADCVLRGGCAHLLGLHSAVHVVAIAALDEAFVHPVVERHIELSLLLKMASVAELRLRFLQKEFARLRVV